MERPFACSLPQRTNSHWKLDADGRFAKFLERRRKLVDRLYQQRARHHERHGGALRRELQRGDTVEELGDELRQIATLPLLLVLENFPGFVAAEEPGLASPRFGPGLVQAHQHVVLPREPAVGWREAAGLDTRGVSGIGAECVGGIRDP